MDKTVIIKNLKLYTMDDYGIIENGYICIENGKITRVSEGEPVGLSGEIIDGRGGYMFPGFIDGHTHLGIIENAISFEGDDCNETNDPITPQLRGIDGINAMDPCFGEALRAGITCVAIGPGSANPIGGQFCIVKTHGVRIDNMVIKAPSAMKFALGENPKGVYHGKSQTPETRMATVSLIREALMKAKKYAEALDRVDAASDGVDDCEEPEFDFKCEALLPVIRREIPAHFHAHRADDIFTAIRIAKEFNLKYNLVHCTEGRLIADEIASEEVGVFVGPNLCDRSKPELRELSFANPSALDWAGVAIGLTTDHPVIPLEYLPLCASLAVKAGMDEYNAFRAITINPARILGIDHRVGSIREGKDADLVIFDGNPLNVMTKVRCVFSDGRLVHGSLNE